MGTHRQIVVDGVHYSATEGQHVGQSLHHHRIGGGGVPDGNGDVIRNGVYELGGVVGFGGGGMHRRTGLVPWGTVGGEV